MALSLDDKLLGEKAHYYCSSSSEDDGSEDDGSDDDGGDGDSYGHKSQHCPKSSSVVPPSVKPRQGGSTNTGPKGVVSDWREYKRLESEGRAKQMAEMDRLARKLTLTCRSHMNDEEEKSKDDEFLQSLQEVDDDVLTEYRLRRIEEMRKMFEDKTEFGAVVMLNGQNFVQEIDKEKSNVTIIVHVYEDNVDACDAMNGCVICLAKAHRHVKFCKITAADARLSTHFIHHQGGESEFGVPAILVYKKGELVGNFPSLYQEFGDDFFASDVEYFLKEYGFLRAEPSAALGSTVILPPSHMASDNDLDLD